MARIFITGSADGLGLLAAKKLLSEGHQVVLHARNAKRLEDLKRNAPNAEAIVVGDLSDIDETKILAQQVNTLGTFDAVIHNAGVYQVSPWQMFTVNTLAPYMLTCLMPPPKRLIYLSSGMHLSGRPNLDKIKKGTDKISYSDTKLHVVMLALAVAEKWNGVYANAVDPGWVPTKMGGNGAPDDLQKGYETQTWLAASNEDEANVTGHYFYHKKQRPHNTKANDQHLRNELLRLCSEITDVVFPS